MICKGILPADTVSSAENGKGERDTYIISVSQFEPWHLFGLWLWFHYKATVYRQRTDSFNVVTVKYKGTFVTYRKVLIISVVSEGIQLHNFSVVLIEACCVSLLYSVKSEIMICSFQISCERSSRKMYLVMH